MAKVLRSGPNSSAGLSVNARTGSVSVNQLGTSRDFVLGETLTFSGATGLFASADAGSHAVTVVRAALVNGAGSVASNYALRR